MELKQKNEKTIDEDQPSSSSMRFPGNSMVLNLLRNTRFFENDEEIYEIMGMFVVC